MSLRDSARRVAAHGGRRLPGRVRDVVRPAARRVGLAAEPGSWWQATQTPWDRARLDPDVSAACNRCGWSGARFGGVRHCESAICPRCGSTARQRFLMWCLIRRIVPHRSRRLRVLEISPDVSGDHLTYLRTWMEYHAIGFDLGTRTADLPTIALPAASFDVVVAAHVLQHLPEPARALNEIGRLLAPGGRTLLQVPLRTGSTRPWHGPTARTTSSSGGTWVISSVRLDSTSTSSCPLA